MKNSWISWKNLLISYFTRFEPIHWDAISEKNSKGPGKKYLEIDTKHI